MTRDEKELCRMSAEIMAKTMIMDSLLDKLVKLGGMLNKFNDLSEHEGKFIECNYSDEITRCEIAIDVIKNELKKRMVTE